MKVGYFVAKLIQRYVKKKERLTEILQVVRRQIYDQINILTPLFVLFLICLYISSRALSKAFELRNFVARYQRETNHTTVAKVASLVTMDASLQYWLKHPYT